MKRMFVFILAFLILCSALAGCGLAGGPADTTPASQAQAQTTTEPEYTRGEQTATLCAGIGKENLERYEFAYTEDLTPALLMQKLSELTGLDFTGTAYADPKGIYIDWDPFSTLVAGLDGREQKEEFFMYDTVSLRWFMMDSLYYTFIENYGQEDVFYAEAGKAELKFDSLGPELTLECDSPYMGSAFYSARDGD